MPGDIPIDGLELGVVRHDVLPAAVLDFHPNVLPDLHCDSPVGEIPIELFDCIRSERSGIELVRIEGRAERDVLVAELHESERIGDLRLKLFAIRERVVHDQDVQQFQVKPFKHCRKRGAAFEHVDVGIDRMKRGKSLQCLFVALPWRKRR